MKVPVISQRITSVSAVMAPLNRFLTDSAWARRNQHDASQCDFVFGAPTEPSSINFLSMLQRWMLPRNNEWFCKTADPAATMAAAAALRQQHGLPFDEDDILLTNGGFAALAVSLNALTNPGDEVIYISPAVFAYYRAYITAVDAVPVRVRVKPVTYNLNIEAIAAAITPRTRAIIINTPHNPTGKIYDPRTLTRLAEVLTQASERIGHPIYLLSDETYGQVVYDNRKFYSPSLYYPNSLVLYTYGKSLLSPGQRLGYVALHPLIDERNAIREALYTAQIVTGYAFPDTILQYALPEIDPLLVDLRQLQRRRNRLAIALRAIGYDVNLPESTFYLLVRAPWADDEAFCELLANYGIYALPGELMEMPGYFRLSLAVNDDVIERAISGFAAAWEWAIVKLNELHATPSKRFGSLSAKKKGNTSMLPRTPGSDLLENPQPAVSLAGARKPSGPVVPVTSTHGG